MGAHRRVIGAEGNMSAPKIRNPEGCRPRTSRISESWHDALVSAAGMGHLRRVDTIANVSALLQKAAVFLRCGALTLRANNGPSWIAGRLEAGLDVDHIEASGSGRSSLPKTRRRNCIQFASSSSKLSLQYEMSGKTTRHDRRAYDKGWCDPPHVEKPGNALHTKGRCCPIRLGANVVYEGDARAFRLLIEIPFDALQHPATTEWPDRKKRS